MANVIVFDSVALRVLLARRGIRTLSLVARQAGLLESYMRHIAGGFIPPSAARDKIADVLGVDPEVLWREVPSRCDVELGESSHE